MASGGAEEDDGGIPLDIDNVHMLLQVEHEQIQKRTFTNWINAQLSKRCPPSFLSDLFSDLKDGSQLLDLLEVMSGQPMKRQRGRGVFQQRANIETALNFLKKKSIKLVNINISDVIDGRPSIILGLIWTIILHCHIEELANTLSFSSRHSSLDSLSSLDSWSGSPIPASPVPAGRTSPLHRRFRVSAKKALLMWVRDQCQKVGCSVSVRDFKSSWRSGEAFLAILCSLRPQLVDLSLVRSRSNQENLEEAFHLAERELHIPRLLEPQDVDVKDPDEKSIMTYVAQFLQYSNDMPAPDDHLQLFPLVQPSFLSPDNLPAHFTPAVAVSPIRQVSPSERAQEVTCWLQKTYQELSESQKATENSSFAEKYQVFQTLADSFTEQRKPVMTLLAAIRRRPELSQEQSALKTAWDRLEEELQRCKAELDSSLPAPLDSVVLWLQRAEAALTEEGGGVKDHADAAKETRTQQDLLKSVIKEMSHHANILDTYHNIDSSGNIIVPLDKFDEIKRRLTNVRVTAKYQGIKLEYKECRHTVLDLLGRIKAKVQTWKAPCRSQETVLVLLQDWHETVERQGLILILMDSLQSLKEKAKAYTSKAALGEGSQRVTRQVKEAESEAELVTQAVTAVRGMMERVVSAWETYNNSITSLQTWLAQQIHSDVPSPAVGTQDMSEWTSCQAKLNEAGNLLIEVTEPSTSLALAEQLSKVNMQWAECMKRTMFSMSSDTRVAPLCLQMVHSLTQEASQLLRQPLEVASVPLKAYRQKLQLLSKKIADVDLSSLSSTPDLQLSHLEKLQQTLPQTLAEAERTCAELQRAASTLEGRLAELDHWSTEALDCHVHLKEKKHRGRPALETTAKVLVSRGLRLESQVVNEGQDLQQLVARVQKTSPLQQLGTSVVQERISEAVSNCQDIFGIFGSLGFLRPDETAGQTQRQAEAGLLVVARTKHVDQVGNVRLQSQDSETSAESSSQTTRGFQHMSTQDEPIIVIPHVQIQMLPQPLRELAPHTQPPLYQTVKEAEPIIQPQSVSKSHTQATSQSQSDQLLPASVGPKTPNSPVLSSLVPEEKEGSSPAQTQALKSRRKGKPNTLQSNKTSPQPPVMVRSEVHSKAQSMARSRLEKARFRLQGRIQQAMKLFGGKEISESQTKKKQRALKILQPVILEEFLCAVEGLGAFCTGPQLQDLMLLSDSVRKQWEDVRGEMAAFVSLLLSTIREGEQCLSVVPCETQTNTLHDATDQTDADSLQQQQAVVDGAASAEERVETLQELCETLTPRKSSILATDQLRESDEAQETQPDDTVLPSDCRGQQLRGNSPLRATGMSADTQQQQGNNLPRKQSAERPQRELSPVESAVSVQLHGDVVQLGARGAPTESEDDLTQRGGCGSVKDLKPALRAKEQPLKVRVMHIAESSQKTPTQIQAVVRGNTVETKQEAEWTVITEADPPPQEELPSIQEVLQRYRKSCLMFQSQLQENKQHLEEFIPEPNTDSALQNCKRQLQTLKQETDARWFDFELQYAQLSQRSHLMTREDKGEVERDWEQLTQQWRAQQMCLQSRMASVERSADLIESSGDQIELMTQKLDQILKDPVDISSFTLADTTLVSKLREMDDGLQSEMRQQSERDTKEERKGPNATSPSPLCPARRNSVHHLEQLRQRLEQVQSAAWALDRFLATIREVKAEIPMLLAKPDPSRQQNEADWEQHRHSWQTALQQKLQTVAEQSDRVDSTLKAVGLSLTMDGAAVTCQDVVTSLSQQAVDGGKEPMRVRKKERKDDLFPVGKEQIQELNPLEICQIKNGDDSPQGHPTPSRMEEESWMRAKRNRLQGGTEAQREEGAETWKSDGGLLEATDQRGRRISQEKGGGEEKESLVQRRAALLDALREIKEAAEQLRLQEPTLPALQQSTRALTDLKNLLAGHLAELQHVRDASSQSDDSQTREVEEAQEEATKAVHERLERCEVLTELLKRFQSLRGELSGTLQRAESTISEQASYMGRDNLHRLHTKVQETKAELSGLGDGIEEVRSVCRQLHMHLRQIPECTAVPFEGEADALMDRWLDISERTDSHIENLHLGLTLWDGILKLGAEVESWSSNKLAVFAECPSFQREEDIRALQNEIAAQEENMERFHRKAAEIQALLQSTEPPLELQVVETQLRKKIEQLRELASEAEDVYRQMVAAKGQITARMAECFNSLQKIQDSLLTLSAPDVATVLAKLKDLLFELQAQDEQAESLLEDLRVMASIASPVSLQSLSADANQLQDKVRNTHQLFSEVEEQTQRNIQALDRLQREREHLEQWLQAVENKAAKEEDLSLLQEEALQQRVRTEAISQLVSSLQSSTLRQSPLVEESSKLLERYDNFQTNRLPGSMEKQSSAQGVCSRLEEGVCSQEHFGKLLQDCHLKLASLQERLSACQSQEGSGPGLITALEAFLQELTETERDLLQIETLKDSIAATSAAETQTELLQQVSNLQNHKRALDSSIREDLSRLTANNNQRVQQVEEEMSCVQRELKDLTEKFEHLSGNQDDISRLKQQWHTMQEFDARLTELAVRVNDLQKTTDLSVTHETLPAGVSLTVDAATKDLHSLRSISLQKKQQCAENTTNRVREVVRQLQKWSETVQDELSSHSQAALDEGSGHQQALREVLSERDFLLNCLGTNVTEDLEKSASDALKQSTSAAETLTKHLVSACEVERDKDKESSESDATYQTLAECPPPCNFLSARDSKENSRSDENGYKVEAKSTLETAKEDAFVPHQDAFKSKPQQNSQRLISNPLKTNLKMDDEVTLNASRSPLSNGHGTLSGNNTVQVRSDSLPTVNKSLTAQQETIEPLQEGPTSAAEADNTNKINSAPCVTTLVESRARNPDNFPSAPRGNVSQLPAAQSETVKAVRDTEEREKRCEDDSVTPKKVFTIMLDIEPEDMQRNENVSQDASRCFPGAVVYDAQSETFKAVGDAEEQEKRCEDEGVTPKKVFTIVLDIEPEDMQRNENVSEDAGRCFQGAVLCDTQPETFKVVTDTQEEEKSCEDISDEVSPERKSESDETDLKIHHLKRSLNTSQVAESLPENPLASVSTELDAAKPTSAKLSHMESQEAQKLTHSDVLNPSKSCVISAESHFTGAHATETTLPGVKLEQLTDVCQAKEQTMSSVLSYVEGDAAAEKQTPAGDSKRLSAADAAQDAATGHLQKTEEASEPEQQKSKPSNLPKKRVKATMLIKGRKLNVPVLLGDSEVTSGQHQIQGSMEPERTAPGSTADLPAEETLGGSPESDKHECSMQGILSEIQSLVERSNIINRTPHVDLNWYLKSSPGEPEIRLVRTVQKVLACRYQPAQLDVAAMAKQLQDAEDFRGSVQEQAATIKSVSAVGICDADALKSLDGQCSAALLDASATVQVKAAQLDQVKQYHKQMRIIRALLEVLSAERDKMSLNALGSSAIQADKLHALLQTMVRKKDKMEELLHLSSQLSVHLSNAESSGTLLAQLGDVQEEWRLLEGRIKRALQHASSSTCQSSLLIKQAEQLKAKLEALQKSSCESQDGKSALEIVCLSTDLKLYNQLYLHLTSQSDALVRFSLGQKEKDEIKRSLQELGSLLNVTKSKLSTSVHSSGGISSAKLNKQLHDLIVWAKQAENHISIGQKLALFPEEARIQISEMRKFQTDIWSRRSRMQAEVEQMKDLASDMGKEESDQVWKTVEELYEAIADSLDHVLDTMKKNLHEREKLLCQLASLDAWLAETHAKRDPCAHVDSVSRADIRKLESKLQGHKLATGEIETQVRLVEAMAESSRELAAGLSPGESRYLVNRLSGLWTELDGLLAHEKATSWELEELIHERTSSDEELSNIQASLQQISTDLEKQKFPLTQENLSTVTRLKHMLMEHQCEVQELQHCQEAKRSSLLCTIGELQDQCKTLSVNAFEQDKYLHLRRQMEESRDIAKEQIERAKDKTINLGERFKLCQTLLVELPLVKTQCQEAADQLEAIAQDLYPSELSSERHRIRLTVETLVSWEYSLTADIKNLESKLLLGLRFPSELPALMELFQRTRVELEGAEPVIPDEKAVDIALRRCWVIWRNMESGMRVLEGLGQKGKVDLGSYKELYTLKDAIKQECHSRMESLSQARETLKDYQWAAQGAIGFLHNAEATFLSAPGGFLDCTEEQRQTQQALEALEEGFQAHISHLTELLPQQPCLSRPKTEQLHISILSQLLVGRATLEAQAQLRLESLQRCETRQQSHRKCHEDVRQHLSGLEVKLSDCAAEQVTSYVKCISQQKRAKLLMEDLRSLAGKIEELRAGCPMQGCGVGKDGELGALWRRWVSLRRGAGLLMANTEQRGEEWKDITTSMEQCCSFLASLQAEVPDSSTVSFTQEEPQELLAQAEMHQAGLEQGQQALASLEHRLEHALSLSSSQDLISPGPVGKTLVKIQENVKSLKERNLQVLAAAQAEERERLQVQKEMGEVEQHVFAILSSLEACSNPREKQELRKDLSSQKAKLKSIAASVQSRYAAIPADISRRLQEVQLSLQTEEDKLLGQSYPVRKLNSQVVELGSGLEKVKVLLEQKSQTVNEAQNVLKRVWDELDAWHSRLMLLENEVQDLAEDHPDQAHLLMDQLTQPLQLYQNAAQMAEQRTAFLSKIPACLQEFDSIVHGATCWLDEAQAWLSAPCCFTTARSLQNHANSLQLVLDDSERIRHALQDFSPVLDEISAVCDMSAQEEKLKQNDQQVHKMQSKVVEPLEQLLQAVGVVEAVETELKTMEKNVPKIRAILSSMDDSNITLTEHLQNRQVILANMQSMRRTLEDMERCKGELHLPHGAEESLLVFSRAKQLLQPLEELEQLTQQQVTLLENKISEENHGTATDSGTPENIQQPASSPQRLFGQEAFEVSNSEEEEDEESASCHSSSSDTLTCSIPEDPEETLNTSDVQLEDIAEVKPLLEVKVPGSGQPPSEVERSLKAGTGLKTKVPENFETGFTTMDSKAGVGKAFNLEAAAEKQFVSAAAASLDQPNPETLVTHPHIKSLRAAPAVEDTRLIPDRPITPFTATRASYEIIDEGDEDLSPTTALRRDRHNLEPSSKQLCILDEFELEQCEVFPSLKDVPSLEQCVLGRHLRESPGEKAKLQQASRSLLQGITRLLDLGEECITEGQMSRVHSRSRLQAALCRRKKLLRVLRSQLAFVQHLFQREPEALRCQEDERLQLEVRAKALQQQALEQEVASQRRVQVWTHWEDNCGRLGRMLEDAEAFISSGDPEGDDEKVAQHRLETCQQTLIQLDDSRAVLGLILDQGKELQTEPGFAATVAHAGGALKLRWQSACNRTEQEIQRCRKIRDSRVRFQTHFTSVSEWLIDASKHLKTWSDLANTSDLNQESIYDHLIKLLDFSMEAEAMSVKRASASKGATQLLHLREADCPELRAQLAQLEVNWSQLTSDLPKIQDQLQQRLLAVWPPVELLSDLEDWLKRLETRLSTEKESLHKATDDGQITETLQHYKGLNAGLVNGQLLLDFLCQSGPRVVPVDDEDLRSESTMFAEKLGALRLQWLHLQRELESQIREAEQMHHTSADRARRLQRLRGWTEQQKKQLNQRKHPTGQTLARKTLLELEAVVGRAKDVTAALQKLKTTRVCVDKGEDHPCDISFAGQTESVCQDCGDLTQQMEALRPALQQTVEQWGCFERELGEVSLHTTRVRCALYQHQPLFSPKQAEGYMDGLQLLQEQAGKGEELWASVDRSFQSLVKGIHRGTAQALGDQMQEERKRWKEAVQELENERMKTAVTVSLWQKYAHLSDQRSHQLQNLRHQWEELMRSPPTKDTQAALHSVELLQVAAEDLQSSVGDVLTASKPLIGRLEPVPANLIQSETRLLSRDVLLLSQATSGKKKSLQEDLDQQKLFQTRLEALEKQTQSVQSKLKSGLNDTDSLEQVLAELSGLFASLVDVSEMSGYETLNNQEAARLRTLRRQWVENMTHMLNMNRDLQVERQRSQSFQEKCENLKSIQKKLEESTSKSPQSYTSLHQMLEVHQRLQAEIITGHQLLQAVLCQTGEAVEKEKGEKRSELMAQVTRMRESWFSAVALFGQRRSLIKEELRQWRIYRRGSKLLQRLLRDVEPLLPPAGPALCALHQPRSCRDDCQCVEDALHVHATVYAQTLEAGGRLCETMTESEQSELQNIQETWKRANSQLERRRDLVDTTVQKWSQCRDGITGIKSELDELETKLKQPLPERRQDSEDEKHIQDTELSLQRLTSGLRELATMKTDLSQYIAAGDSGLLEQQLEQLHAQWEELCMKVSLRRQEIADRLNAWTIFNDKNKEFCDWLTQMENKVCHSGDLSIEEMVEKLKKDCMEEINLFSENKSHLKQLGEQLLLASDEAKQTQVHGSLLEVNQRWHNLFHHIEARVKKLKETLVTVQQLDKNMSNLRSWLCRMEAELSRPITYSVCHHQEIQRRLAEQQELQRDIEQHTEGVASVLSLCDVLLRDEDAAGGTEAESDSLQETSRSLDQRWRTICAMALDRRLRIEETWRLWCKFLDDYSRFEDWLKMAERTAANPNSADVLYTVAKEELKKFEGFQRQVHERLTQLELVNNQYRRLARENRTDRASQLKAMVHEGNRRWDTLHRRVASILRRLKYFTSQREDFEGTRESMLVWLTELDLQLTNVEHFSESDVHHKIQQLNSFQKEITLNTERIDGLIVFGEGLIQRSSPQDAALIEDELEELHSYCQEVFSRLVRFHQRLSQPPMIKEEPELSGTTFSLAASLELICRPWLGRTQGSLPATPTHLLTSPMERSGRETPVSVDSLPLEWDHTVDVGGSSSHEDDEEEEEEDEEERTYFSALSEVDLTESPEEFVEAPEALRAASLASSRSLSVHESPRWRSQTDAETRSLQLDSEGHTEAPPTLTSTPLKPGYLRLMSQCSGSIEDIKRVSLILDDEEQPEELGLTGLTASDKQSGVIERWELLQAQSRTNLHTDSQEPRQLTSDLDDITSWLENMIPTLECLQQYDPSASVDDMAGKAKELKEMHKMFAHYKSIMLSVNLRAQEAPELQERVSAMNRDWSRACTGLQQWDTSLREKLMRCQEFHETLHSLLLWLAHAESRRYAVDISNPETPVRALQQHRHTLTSLQEELQGRQTQQASLQALWSQLQPEEEAEESEEAREKLHVTGSKLRLLLRQVEQDLSSLQQRLVGESAAEVPEQGASAEASQEASNSKKASSTQREKRDSSPPRSLFYRVLRAAFPLHLLFLFLLLLPCLIPLSESEPACTGANNFARSFYPMLRYTNGPPPT